jgi:hypothetical protein
MIYSTLLRLPPCHSDSSVSEDAALIKKKKNSSCIRKFRRSSCKVIFEEGLYEEMHKYLVVSEEAVSHDFATAPF